MIWKYAVPRDQVVDVRFHPPTSARAPVRFSSHTTPPGMLRACRQSREEILKDYDICITTEGSDRKIRFNGVSDTMFLWQDRNVKLESGHWVMFPDPTFLPYGFEGVERLLLSFWYMHPGRIGRVSSHFVSLKVLSVSEVEEYHSPNRGHYPMRMLVHYPLNRD